MNEYDLITIGSGSVMSVVSQVLTNEPELSVAVIEKDEAGGICLTRGCIPSKYILYPAEMVNKVKEAEKFGIETEVKNIDFNKVMNEMREHIDHESESIERNLKMSEDIDFYHTKGEFVDDYTLKVDDQKIRGDKILICSGSQPSIPPIDGIDDVDYLTSESLLRLKKRPDSLTIVGGGYIAAEYGYFMAMMGTDVTIIGRNTQFVPDEEPEVSDTLKNKLSRYMNIYTGYEVVDINEKGDKKAVIAEGVDGERKQTSSDEILIATGRSSNSKYLKPEKSGIETDDAGWINVNDKLETTKKDIWAMGDAVGKHLFKHVANYEAEVVYHNAFQDEDRKVDYHAIPHAIFTYPQVASVGMDEKEAKKDHDILIGYQSYTDTAKGAAMKAEDYFVKVIVDSKNFRILGAHIIGPEASVLLQEVIDLMYTNDQSVAPIYRGMHIHPSLSEVVERAFFNLHSHEHSHEHHH